MGLYVEVNMNDISFLSIVLATIFVAGVCVYGSVQSLRFGRVVAGFGILIAIPLWFGGQLFLVIIYEKLVYLDIATREYHLDYAITPLLNLAGAALVGYVVINYVRRLVTSRAGDPSSGPHRDTKHGAWGWFLEPRKIAGLILIAVGAASMSYFFVVPGVLFIIVGVSLIMNIRLWRS